MMQVYTWENIAVQRGTAQGNIVSSSKTWARASVDIVESRGRKALWNHAGVQDNLNTVDSRYLDSAYIE